MTQCGKAQSRDGLYAAQNESLTRVPQESPLKLLLNIIY